jgi:hypothetical protein
MMSALRNIHDRYYVRDLGGDGGVKLEWRGKAGCIFAATGGARDAASIAGAGGSERAAAREGEADAKDQGARIGGCFLPRL